LCLCLQLEEAGSKALSEVSSLNEEVEELKSKDGLVKEMQKRMKEVEAELELKQTEVGHWILLARTLTLYELILDYISGSQ